MTSKNLSVAFTQLCAVVRPRPDMTANMEAAASRVFKVLSEYSEPVALTALDMWPRHSEWFPTEKELRDLLDAIKAESEREAAARGQGVDGTYLTPTGNTALFVDRVRRTHGDDYVKSWLAGGINCIFSADKVYTTGVGFDRLNKDCAFIAQAAGVSIVRSKQASAMLAAYCDKRDLKHEPKRVRK